jgi:hypothetical protein
MVDYFNFSIFNLFLTFWILKDSFNTKIIPLFILFILPQLLILLRFKKILKFESKNMVFENQKILYKDIKKVAQKSDIQNISFLGFLLGLIEFMSILIVNSVYFNNFGEGLNNDLDTQKPTYIELKMTDETLRIYTKNLDIHPKMLLELIKVRIKFDSDFEKQNLELT